MILGENYVVFFNLLQLSISYHVFSLLRRIELSEYNYQSKITSFELGSEPENFTPLVLSLMR